MDLPYRVDATTTASKRKHDDEGATTSAHHHNSSTSDDNSAYKAGEFKVYPIRWYILGIFALCGTWQVLVYSTFGPISKSAELALKLTQTDLALLPNWYNIAFMISAFPFVWLVEAKGLRLSMTATMAFCAMGASVRCLHTGDKEFDKFFLHLGQFINGFGAAVPWFACTTLSAVWFPPKERNLATALGLFISGLGVSFGFLIGPEFVKSFSGSGSEEEIYDAIYKLLYLEAVVCDVLLFLTIFYFPARPPTPPSFSAATKRVSYWNGIRQFSTNPNAWIMFAIYGLNTMTASWNQFIALTVEDVMEEAEVGWLGFTMTALSVAAGPILAAILVEPCVAAKSRQISIAMITLACALIAVYVVATNVPSQKYLLSKELVWATLLPMLTLATCAQPIWWEMACDCVFPVPESIVSSVFSYGSCVISVVFYVVLMFPQLGFMWINWVLLVSQVLIIPLLLLYRHDGKRSAADLQHKIDDLYTTTVNAAL